MSGPQRAAETARIFRAAAGGMAPSTTPPAARPTGPGAPPPGPARSKFTVLLDSELAAGFDELALRLRRVLGRRVGKADVVRALVLLAGDDPTLFDQLAAELQRDGLP